MGRHSQRSGDVSPFERLFPSLPVVSAIGYHSPRFVGIRYQPVPVDVPWRLRVNPRRYRRHLSNRRATAGD